MGVYLLNCRFLAVVLVIELGGIPNLYNAVNHMKKIEEYLLFVELYQSCL